VGHMPMMERPQESVDSFIQFAGEQDTMPTEVASEEDTSP